MGGDAAEASLDWHAAARGTGRAFNALHTAEATDWLNALVYEDFRRLFAKEEQSGGWRYGDGSMDTAEEETCLEWQRPTAQKDGE